MTTPENKAISIVGLVAQDLWQKAVAGTPESDNLRLKRRLRSLDRCTQRLFESAFGQTFRERRFFIEDAVSVHAEGYEYRVGYSNDEANQGLRFLIASWANRAWSLRMAWYHLAGYHRLHNVTISHQTQQVVFLPPSNFEGKYIQANTLPGDIKIKQVA